MVIEELLINESGVLPSDYKLHVFNGKCRAVEVGLDRFTDLKELRFTTSWELIPDYPADVDDAVDVQPPEHLARMIAVAERLGKETDYVRVDLYQCGDRIVFGELTNYSGGGSDLAGSAADLLMGSFWTVPKRYSDLPKG